MTESVHTKNRWFTHFRLQWRRYRMNRKLAILLAFAAIASGAATFATMTSSTGSDPKTIITLLYLDAVLLLLLGSLVARRLGPSDLVPLRRNNRVEYRRHRSGHNTLSSARLRSQVA
ncbi:MAG: hypothetical protein ACO3MW_13350, partial [Rhodospirillales bacterium]